MAAAKLRLAIEQGATFAKPLTWVTYPYPIRIVNGVVIKVSTGLPAPDSDRVYVDLTGCTARMQIRSDITSAIILCSLTTSNGGITLGGVAGTIAILIDATATALFTFEEAVYDLEIIMSDTITVHRLVGGCVTVSPEVTR